jgi:hypothetical protein
VAPASHATIILTWQAIVGQTYQVQYTTNLLWPNWNNLGNQIFATNGTVTATEALGPDPARFYRLLLLP